MRRLAMFACAACALTIIVWIARTGRSAPARRETEAPDGPTVETTDSAAHAKPETSEARTLPSILVDPTIEIDKSRRSLTVYSDGSPAKTYRVALGADPMGDKEREGDNRTPEGDFYVCTKNAESAYHRALGLSYPNEEYAERGLNDGLISSREHRQLLDALRHFRQPSWKTALGGEIMIHGGGTASDWTEGCIALSDSDAEELFDAIPLGTPVTIVP